MVSFLIKLQAPVISSPAESLTFDQNPLIVGVARTPITQFGSGGLASLSATKLGAIAIRAALIRANVPATNIQEVFFGQVLQAGAGQAPARQASLGAGLPESVACTTVNKVCASGMKAIMLAALSIKSGHNDFVVAGGMESMSQVPRYLKRAPPVYGNVELTDGILFDGLTDAYDKFHMGICAENTCKEHGIGRQEQDHYAISSYKRAQAANESGLLAQEIVSVELPAKRPQDKSVVIEEDEEFKKIDLDRIPKLRPAFDRESGTVTAANASTLNDGAAATVLVSPQVAEKHKLQPLAEVIGFADAACKPIDFPIAPALSIPKALEHARLDISDIARWEINEAFSAVVLANISLLKLDPKLVNVNGGAVSLGHPIGMSGARIVNSLALHLKSGQYGVASICNGGGGASTVILKKL